MTVYDNSRHVGTFNYPRVVKWKDDVVRNTQSIREINRSLEDIATVPYVIKQSDKLFNIAYDFYKSVSDRPEDLWWIIADKNPQIDPLKLEHGETIWLPAPEEVREIVSQLL